MRLSVFFLLAMCLPGAAHATEQQQWVTPEVRDAITASVERATLVIDRLPGGAIEDLVPDFLALVADSDSFLKQDSRPAKHYAICLRRMLAYALVSRIQMEEYLLAQGIRPVSSAVDGEDVRELWNAIRIPEREWVEACIVPGSTVGRWAEANDVGRFLEDPGQMSPLPGYASEWLRDESKLDIFFWMGNSAHQEHPIKVGSSTLFAEACRLVQLLRDLDVYVHFWESTDPSSDRTIQANLDRMVTSSNGRRLDLVGIADAADSERMLRRSLTFAQNLGAAPEDYESCLVFLCLHGFTEGNDALPFQKVTSGHPYVGIYLRNSTYVFDEDEVPPERDPESGDPALTETVRLTLPGEVALEMVKIPAGSFTMGSRFGIGRDNERPLHKVRIGYEFLIGKYEITQEQWTAVMGSNPSVESGGIGPSRPVQNVSWEDAQAFVKALNRLEIGTFRLPSEAEWEYACRGGTTMSYHFGHDESLLGDYAWFWDNSDVDGTGRKTQPVGQKLPNPYGLYDMYGNVWEWCQDRFGAYSRTPRDGRAFDELQETYGYARRGGAFDKEGPYCRSAFRGYESHTRQRQTCGLRVVCAK